MAALDDLRERPIRSQQNDGAKTNRQLAVKRAEIREIVGTKLMREITLK